MLYKFFLYTFLLSSTISFSQINPPTQNYVLRFDGNSISRAPLPNQLNLSNSFTMEAWVYVESYSPYSVIMGKPHNPRSQDPFMSYVIEISDQGQFEFVQSTGQSGTYRAVTATSKVELNKWTHIAAVLSNGSMKLYINGNEAASGVSPGTANNTTVPFAVGAGADPNGNISAGGFNGALMQARVWNYGLTENEIKNNISKLLNGNENGLLAYWPLDDGVGDNPRNLTGSNLNIINGTASGSGKPKWIKRGLLDSLNTFFKSTSLTASSSIQNLSELISFDYDQDGDSDLILLEIAYPPTVPATQKSIAVMRNDGKGNFSNVTESWVNNIKFVHPRHWAIADFDKDGRKDILIVDHGTDVTPFPGDQSRILRSMTSGILAEETNSRLPIVNAFTHNVASADIDNDGDIDIYMCNIQGGGVPSPRIYVNNGNGVFSENQSRLPSVITSFQRKYMSSAFSDVDNDGDYDLILGGHDGYGPNELFPKDAILLNDGTGNFTFASESVMPDRMFGAGGGTVAIMPVDFNNDGWIDLMMSTLLEYKQGGIQILANNRNGTFREESAGIIQSWPISQNFGNSWIKWNYVADLNNDGRLDIIAVGQNDSPIKIFLNRGSFKFQEITDYVSIHTDINNCVADDFDGDGRIDIIGFKTNRDGVFLKNIKDFTVITGVNDSKSSMPTEFYLSEPFPNPFNPETTIEFSVPYNTEITLKVFDLLGREVAVIASGLFNAGYYKYNFNARELSSGIYFYQMSSPTSIQTKKMILLK